MSPSRNFLKNAPATWGIILFLVAIHLITALQSGSLTHNLSGSGLAEAWVLYGPYVATQPYRLVTYAFVHSGLYHLTVNCASILVFCWSLERYLGSLQLIATFLVTALGAGLSILLFDAYSATVGASGTIFAFLAICVAVAAKHGGNVRAIAVFLVINVAYTFIGQGISIWGHLGGLLIGGLIAYPLARFQARGRAITLTLAATVLCITCFVPIDLSTVF